MAKTPLPVPEVSIALGETVYEMAYTFESFVQAKQALARQGIEINMMQSFLFDRIDYEHLGPLLWAAIRARHPEVKLADIVRHVDISNAALIYARIVDAYVACATPRKAKTKNDGADEPA